MKQKKAQLKIQEMAFMIVAVVLFFVLAGLFIFSVFYMNMLKEANNLREWKTLSSAINLADSPEFSCVDSKSNCIDTDKLITLLNKKIYTNLWQFSSLKIIRDSGFNKTEEKMIKCSSENYPNCDIFLIYDKKVKNERAITSYAALCRSEYEEGIYEKCEIGKLIAGNEVII